MGSQSRIRLLFVNLRSFSQRINVTWTYSVMYNIRWLVSVTSQPVWKGIMVQYATYTVMENLEAAG